VKKRLASLALCILLLFQMGVSTAGAVEGDVYFVAAEENILPLSSETMPFWHNGYLYISSSIFTGIARKSLGVSYVRGTARQPTILYSGEDRSLFYDTTKNHATDAMGAPYYPGAVQRNGQVFVPASVVASFFGLQYSVTDVSNGYLVWLRKPDFGLNDRDFANAASYAMAEKYSEYQKNKGQTSSLPSDTGAGVEITGQRVYLCLEAGEQTGELLGVLNRYESQAAFFCSVAFLETHGDLLRQMTVTGQSIGILVDEEDSDMTVEEQLEAGNRALERATCGRTRLVMVEGGSEQTLQAVSAAGYRCLQPELDRADYELHSASNALNLLQRVRARREETTIWLADTANALGLRAFLTNMEQVEGRCLAWTETA